MNEVFEVVVDAFGKVIDIRNADTLESCFVSLLLVVLGVILVAIGALIYIFFMLIVEGFKALFGGKIGMALLYFAIPAILSVFLWINFIGSFVENMLGAPLTTPKEGSIKGYFIYPNIKTDQCEIARGLYAKGTYDYPDEIKRHIVETVNCFSKETNVLVEFWRFDNSITQEAYKNWVRQNGIKENSHSTVRENVTDLGTEFFIYSAGYDMQNIVWTVDKYSMGVKVSFRGIVGTKIYQWKPIGEYIVHK